MNSFLPVRRAKIMFISEQVEKGNLFFKTGSGRYVPCGPYREGAHSYDAMPIQHIIREMSFGNIYYKAVNK